MLVSHLENESDSQWIANNIWKTISASLKIRVMQTKRAFFPAYFLWKTEERGGEKSKGEGKIGVGRGKGHRENLVLA